MAYRPDANGDIIISGWQNGIGASPESGLTDLRNIEIVSVPGEAPIGFGVTSQIGVVTNVVVTSFSTPTLNFASTAGLQNGMAIFFNQLGSLTLNGGTTVGPYWLQNVTATSATLSSTYATNTAVTLGGSVTGNPTFSTYQVGMTTAGVNIGGINWYAFDGTYYWGLDAVGQVWSNISPIGASNPLGGNIWSYTGNKVPGSSYTSGNGLVFFVFHNSSIDYTKTASGNISWNYQYNPSTHSSGSYSATPSQQLNSGVGFNGSHMAIRGLDNAIYYCDTNYLGSIVPTNSAPYDPTVAATYTWNKIAVAIPPNDNMNCLAELGINLLIGGQLNYIYPWNKTTIASGSALYTAVNYPIRLSESNVQQMITVNTNTYIFIGNRGRIYITNGTQAQLAYKIPDHLSGTVVPYFFWGGVASNRNELYFGVYATTNAGVALTTGNEAYGGVWAINLDTGAMRLINQLSYGTYAGYASALIAIVQPLTGLNGPYTKPPGTGLYIGWASATPGAGGTTYGIDETNTIPYTGGQAYVISDLIPIGTNLEPQTPQQYEFKLSTPLQSSESVALYGANNLTDMLGQTGSYALIGTTTGGSALSYLWPNPLPPSQWLILKAVLTGQSSTPSYNRLVEIRVKGITKKLTAYYSVPQ